MFRARTNDVGQVRFAPIVRRKLSAANGGDLQRGGCPGVGVVISVRNNASGDTELVGNGKRLVVGESSLTCIPSHSFAQNIQTS